MPNRSVIVHEIELHLKAPSALLATQIRVSIPAPALQPLSHTLHLDKGPLTLRKNSSSTSSISPNSRQNTTASIHNSPAYPPQRFANSFNFSLRHLILKPLHSLPHPNLQLHNSEPIASVSAGSEPRRYSCPLELFESHDPIRSLHEHHCKSPCKYDHAAKDLAKPL